MTRIWPRKAGLPPALDMTDLWCGVTAGTAAAQTLAPGIRLADLVDGDEIRCVIGAGLTNTGAMTLDDGRGAKTVKMPSGGDPPAGYIKANGRYKFVASAGTWVVVPGDTVLTSGTFTPDLVFATPGTSSMAYGTRDGQWLRLGPASGAGAAVFVTGRIQVAPTKGTGSGQARYGSLPFTVSGNAGGTGLDVHNMSSQFTWPSSATQIEGRFQPGQSFFLLLAHKSGANSAVVAAADITDAVQHEIRFSGWYMT